MMANATIHFSQEGKKEAKIFLTVNDAHAEARYEGDITEGAVGIKIYCKITGQRWEGKQKMLVFANANEARSKPLEDGDECVSTVPHEILVAGQLLLVGIDGWSENWEERIPTILAGACWVKKSTASLKPLEPLPPEPDVVDLIFKAARNAVSIAEDVKKRADDGEFNGEDGFDPEVSTQKIEGGNRVTITDRAGSHSFDVLDGAKGISPTVAFAPIQGGYRVTITDKDGPHSADVLDGISPTVAVTAIAGGHRITITDAMGLHSADVMDGDDYVLTDADREAIAALAKYDDTDVKKNIETLQKDSSNLVRRLKSGSSDDAELHLGFYLDENGDLCQEED